ncbi:glycosyltransferase family protein [Ekhidna lutea]|nr:glycosyltransferase family 4 protein [Ekhidna lutea]
MINNPPDIIYSRSYPLSSSVAAYKLVKYFKVPWVLHLSDPWEDSPLHQYSPKGKSYHKIWENLCFNQANAICLTSQKSIEFYSKKYPKLANKFQLFPNVFDPSEIKRNRYQIRDKLRIVYTGGLAGTRSPNTFLEGLQQFNKVSGMSNLLEVIFAGPCDRKMQAVIKKFNLSNFKYVGSLSLEESIKLQRTADILLIIDSHIHSEELSMYFPSKILEYLIAQRRIVSLTTKNSSTAHIMSQLGFHSIDLEDVDEIANHLGFLADKLVSKSYSYFQIENVPEEFSASYNANRLAELLNNV